MACRAPPHRPAPTPRSAQPRRLRQPLRSRGRRNGPAGASAALAAPGPATPSPAAALLPALGRAWDAAQVASLYLAAAGAAACAVAALAPAGRAWLRATASSFRASPEGGLAAQLLSYMALLAVARAMEAVTGVRGVLTFVYLCSAALAMRSFLARVPGPAEARARVEALERGELYTPPPPPPPAGR